MGERVGKRVKKPRVCNDRKCHCDSTDALGRKQGAPATLWGCGGLRALRVVGKANRTATPSRPPPARTAAPAGTAIEHYRLCAPVGNRRKCPFKIDTHKVLKLLNKGRAFTSLNCKRKYKSAQ